MLSVGGAAQSRSRQATVVADEVRSLRSASVVQRGLLDQDQKPDQDQKIASKLAPTELCLVKVSLPRDLFDPRGNGYSVY